MKENEALKKKEYIGALLLIYGKLLTKNIYQRMEACYLMDYSITEISENESVSRNAVFESLENGEKKLEFYEKKLGLYQRNKKLVQMIEKIKLEQDSVKKEKLLDDMKGVIENGI